MRTLQEAISRMENKGGAGSSLKKHLDAVRIKGWGDISRSSLYELRDHLSDAVAPSTAKTILAYLKSLLHRYCDDVELPTDWEKILQAKAARPMKTYLNEDDLRKMEGARVHTVRQTYAKNIFLICAFTGLRVSDAMNLAPENIEGGVVRFVAQKTKKEGAVPLKAGLEERIAWVASHPEARVTLAAYNKAIRKMAKDAGIDDEVVVFKAGKEMRGPKWMFISSHTARISTATCLNKRGVPIGDICALLQHSGTSMTERYVIRDHVELSANAMAFFK